jgi:uncharacterized damage-inducible protein DinB
MPIHAIASVVRLNTRLFLNCLEDVTDEQALRRAGASANHLAFVATHLVDSRYFACGYLGLELAHPFGDRLDSVTSIEDATWLPSLRELRTAWQGLAVSLEACVRSLDDDDLRGPSPQRFPVDDPTLAGGIAFLVQHESYHIGQMAMLRKLAGHPAMKYG